MFVQRDSEGRIVGTFANAQPGFATEWVEGAVRDPIPPTREEVDASRARAFADPVNGSDRLYAKVTRLTARGASSEEIASALEAADARYEEIQSEFPRPAE